MLELVYFARVREQLGRERETIACPAGVAQVGQLIEYLVAERGDAWRQVLTAPNLLIAVNQEMVDRAAPLADGDEVAFFPPVTGG